LLSSQTLLQAVLPGMQDAGFGRIINITSTSVKAPIDGLGISNTIRGAVSSWSKTLSRELGHFGITVNSVLPGNTRTERMEELIGVWAREKGKTEAEITAGIQAQIPMKRFAEPEEIGNAVAFLASPAASYISGVNLLVDGGKTNAF
ncbi:MAG: 3-oxoacyl-[acyl-carrier protein] reductase, partial [Limisphaerales bacterium]